jgi:uncharacterized protein YciI
MWWRFICFAVARVAVVAMLPPPCLPTLLYVAARPEKDGGSVKMVCHVIPFPSGDSVHFLLMYELAPDYLERRGEFRNEHLKLAWEAEQRGEILIAGALADPADTAVLLFTGNSADVAERFARTDPYVLHGLVKSWRVRPWTTVVGRDASNPVRPE